MSESDDGSENCLSLGAQCILSGAAELFANSGYDAVSVQDIASRAGVSKANVYHHFESKELLYLAVLEQACSGVVELLDSVLEQQSSLEESLVYLIRQHLALLYEDKVRTHLVMREWLALGDGRGPGFAEKVFAKHFDRWVELFDEAKQKKKLREGVEPALIAFVISALNMSFYCHREALARMPGGGFAVDNHVYADMLSDLILRGALTRL